VRVGVGDDRHLMVHLVDQPAHVVRREVLDLRLRGELEEVPRATAALFLVGVVAREHVPSGAPHRAAQLEVQRLGALRSADAHHVPRLDPLTTAEGELYEHRGVALEDLRLGDVGHLATLATLRRWRPSTAI
jgi:hypothetical protein